MRFIRHSLWCGREDSNLHRITPTSPSSWRVYHSATTAYQLFMAHHNEVNGAGEENRTLTVSLEGWSSTIKLHPHFEWSGRQDSNLRPPGPKPGALPSWATSRSQWRSRRESNPRSPAWQAGMLTATPLDLFKWWPVRDSNPCMHAWKACVLNRFTNGPYN